MIIRVQNNLSKQIQIKKREKGVQLKEGLQVEKGDEDIRKGGIETSKEEVCLEEW